MNQPTIHAPDARNQHRATAQSVADLDAVSSQLLAPASSPVASQIGSTLVCTLALALSFAHLPKAAGAEIPLTPRIDVLKDAPTVYPYGFDFDGRFAVWRDTRDSKSIYAFDFLTGQEIKVSEGSGQDLYNSRVSNGVVVWYNGSDNKIYGRDLLGTSGFGWSLSSPTEIVAMPSSPLGSYGLDISGDWLVYSKNMTYSTGDISALNLRTKEQIELPSPATEWNPIIEGNTIAYISSPAVWEWAGTRNWDVLGYNLQTRTPFEIMVGPGNFQPANIDGNRIALNQAGPYFTDFIDRSVVVKDLTTGSTLFTATDAGPGAIWGDYVAYAALPDRTGRLVSLTTGDSAIFDLTGATELRFEDGRLVWIDTDSPSTWSNSYFSSVAVATPDASNSSWLVLLALTILGVARRRVNGH